MHIVVRKDNAVVDPFTRDGASEACANTSAVDAGRAGSASGSSNAGSRIAADGLWLPEVASSLGYKPGEIFQIGFAARQVTWQELEVDHEAGGQVTATSPALVLFARLSHLKANDRLRFTLEGPGFTPMDQTTAPLPRNQSVYAGFAGRRLTGARWAAGTYRGATEIIRDGQVIARKEATLSVPE